MKIPLLFIIIFLVGLTATISAQDSFNLDNLSSKYDLHLELNGREGNVWHGPVSIQVNVKNGRKPFYRLDLDRTFFDRRSDGSPEITNIADKANGNWSGLYFEDLNFDGNEDLAIADGLNGGYSGVSYRIYLYEPMRNTFKFSQLLTTLAQGPYIGIPVPDSKKKTLSVFWKSSCCMHFQEIYTVHGEKVILTAKISEYSDPRGDGFNDIETRKLINGRWRVWKKRVKSRS